MNLVKARILGFCMGVRRAVEMAEAELASAASTGIFTAGPLIHNPQTLASLARRGVTIIQEKELEEKLMAVSAGPQMAGRAVIIRAHGISPALEECLAGSGARLVDATCPRVKASQLAARSLAEKGYRIFLAGERDHAEVIGISGYVRAGSGLPCIIAGTPGEAAAAARLLYEKEPEAKTALIGQTTISEEEYRAAARAIAEYFPGLEIKDTICGATRERQDALRELCSAVDAVIIAGGKDSANTRRLLAIACGLGKPVWLAESAGDILGPAGTAGNSGGNGNSGGLAEQLAAYKTVGLSAGASTPDSVIDEIAAALEKIGT